MAGRATHWLFSILALTALGLAGYAGYAFRGTRQPAIAHSSNAAIGGDRATPRGPALVLPQTVLIAPPAPSADDEDPQAAIAKLRAQRENAPSPLDEVRGSGSSHERWTEDASEQMRTVLVAPDNRIEVRQIDCFNRGCVATTVYPDMNSFEEVSHALPSSEGFLAWPGSKGRSPPSRQPDGSVLAQWIFFRPDT